MEVCQNVTHPQFLGMALFVADITALPLTRDCWVGAAAVFLAAALLDWYAPRDNSGKLQAAGLWLLRAGWVLITAMLAYQGLRTRALPITSAAEVLLSIAWGLAGLAGFLDLTFNHRLPSWAIGSATAVCLVIAAGLGVVPHPSVTANKPMLMMHVGAAVLAYCVLAAQALNSAAYLLQDRALAKRQFGGIYALLPSLVPLDRVGSQLLGAAVWLLGLSLVIGATDWAQRDLALVALPKLSASLLTWVAGLYVIIQRRRHRLAGAAFARASLWACVPALIALYLSLPHAR
ncbi:MAG: hypothetical protein EBQ59_05370 [Verrucomicrobia bacterium]|nr:hypothetical protein [Verrucomicrobiota bacterium]